MPNFTIIAADGTWVVRADGAVIGESTRAVRVVEADGPGAIYFPRDDLGWPSSRGRAECRRARRSATRGSSTSSRPTG